MANLASETRQVGDQISEGRVNAVAAGYEQAGSAARLQDGNAP
ncbi:hypothetical protein [Bradyrhizobium sp. CCBAU 45321]|nr:hypothetical protein [Bradyrhizobium sp. CCBAU 45321]